MLPWIDLFPDQFYIESRFDSSYGVQCRRSKLNNLTSVYFHVFDIFMLGAIFKIPPVLFDIVCMFIRYYSYSYIVDFISSKGVFCLRSAVVELYSEIIGNIVLYVQISGCVMHGSKI